MVNGFCEILKVINKHPGITQRAIAAFSPFSLGKNNAVIQSLLNSGYIQQKKYKNKHQYYITNLGIDFLAENLHLQIEQKVKLHHETYHPIQIAVILAAGYKKDFSTSISYCEIGHETLIMRQIRQLQKIGIQKIIIVSGKQAGSFAEISDEKVQIIFNEADAFTGSMYSLYVAKELITEDFLLMENDIFIENQGIWQLATAPKRDCMLISGLTDSKDEAYVEIKEDTIYKISKDISQLNRVDGEMIGISKISFAFFEKMINFYQTNQNSKMNYEYVMLEIAKIYPLQFVKIDSCIWHEIDTLQHYKHVVHDLLPKLEKKETSLQMYYVKENFSCLTHIPMCEIRSIVPIGGMTNFNFRMETTKGDFVFRISGNYSNQMINREYEQKNENFAYQLNLIPKILYTDIEKGWKVTRFLKDCETQTSISIRSKENLEQCASIFKMLHTSEEKMDNSFVFLELVQQYERIIGTKRDVLFIDYEEIKDQVIRIYQKWIDGRYKSVPCHNDPVPENFLKDIHGKMFFIDWEYAGMNDALWDLSSFCLESELSTEEERLFLSLYFQEEAFPKDELLRVYQICQDFLWSLWTCAKLTSGQTYGDYGMKRYTRCKQNLGDFLKIKG